MNRICWFGDIINNEMVLNEYGRLANKYWLQIPVHYKHVIIDNYIIMPNHIHGIIKIDNDNIGVGTEQCSVPTIPQCSVPTENKIKKYGLLSKIIKSYKNTITNQIKIGFNYQHFKWQRSFHDRIIRNEYVLNAIRRYIINNPRKWEVDRNNKKSFEKI